MANKQPGKLEALAVAGQTMTPVTHLVSTGGGIWIYPVQGPIMGPRTPEEAQRVADAVNEAWRKAIAAENAAHTAAQRAIEYMERTGWHEDGRMHLLRTNHNDPARPGLYEVQWDDHRCIVAWAWFEGVSDKFPYGWRNSLSECGVPPTPETARERDAAGYRPLRWRGITEAQARKLGVAC